VKRSFLPNENMFKGKESMLFKGDQIILETKAVVICI
jgi:hypothetical protein